MNIDQLAGRYARLKHELDAAYAAAPWRDAHINRLADDIVSVEQQLSLSRCSSGSSTELKRQSSSQVAP